MEGICSVTYLSRVENNQIKPSYNCLSQIAARLGVAVEYLLNRESGMYLYKINEVVAKYRAVHTIGEEDMMFLSMHALEVHTKDIHLKIYATLLHYFIERQDLKEAKKLYEFSTRFIDDREDEIYSEDFFHYFAICGSLFYQLQDFITANHFYVKAERLTGFASEREAAKLMFNISLVKQKISEDKSVCLYYSDRAFAYFENMRDEDRLVRVMITQGIQYHLIQNYGSAMRRFQQALEIVGKKNDLKLLAMIEYNFGRVHQCTGNTEMAIGHFERAIELNNENGAVVENVYAFKRLVEIYTEQKSWIISETYLNQAITIAKEYELHFDCIELYAIRARAFKLRFDDNKYEREVQRVIQLCLELNQLSLVKKLANELGAHYYDKRAYKKAADYYTLAVEYSHKMALLTQPAAGSQTIPERMHAF